MTCTEPRFYAPPFPAQATPMWFAFSVMEQQIRMMQVFGDLMMRANPWIVMVQAGSVNPLAADAALSGGDEPDDLPLDSGVVPGEACEVVHLDASAAPAADRPAPDEPDEPGAAARSAEASATTEDGATAPKSAAPEATAFGSTAAPETSAPKAPGAGKTASTPASRKRARPASAKAAPPKARPEAASGKAVTARKPRAAPSGRGRRRPSAPPQLPGSGGKGPKDGPKED